MILEEDKPWLKTGLEMKLDKSKKRTQKSALLTNKNVRLIFQDYHLPELAQCLKKTCC